MVAHGAPILVVFGLFTALMAVSTPIISMLQGIGRTDVPVKSLVAGMVVKIGMNYLLVSNPNINVQGAAVGTILFYAVIVSVNLYMLLRVTKTKLRALSVLGKPLLCAVLSAAAAWASNGLVAYFGPQLISGERLLLLVQIVVAVGFAVLVYAFSMLLTRALSEDDLEFLPGGKKIAKTLAKHKLLG